MDIAVERMESLTEMPKAKRPSIPKTRTAKPKILRSRKLPTIRKRRK